MNYLALASKTQLNGKNVLMAYYYICTYYILHMAIASNLAKVKKNAFLFLSISSERNQKHIERFCDGTKLLASWFCPI